MSDLNIEELKSRLDNLVKEECGLLKQLHEIHDAQQVIKLKLAKLVHGITLGCVVINSKGVRHRVTKLDVSWTKPWAYGNPEKKDGTFGTAERSLYKDWTVEKA